ncbi:unnamed protein product [Acanthoscelides obtectus]|nr:unnamed protein product [Acanthoscelides obtectus]CAK1663372.1 Acetylcholinesterase 1 [Acanthoscelides obtectus]
MHYIPIKSDEGSLTGDWAPVMTKDFVPAEPMTDAIDSGRFHRVPLLFGFNDEECLSPIYLKFLLQIKRKAKVWDRYPSNMIQNTFNVDDRSQTGEDIKQLYTNKSFSKDLPALIRFCTDDQFTLPVGRHAESASKHGVPVYMYILGYRYIPHFIPGIEGTAHGEDLFLYWDSFITKASKLIFNDYRPVSKKMVRLLSNFVKYKKPLVGRDKLFENLKWPKFESKRLQYMWIDEESALLSDPRNYSTKRVVWDRHAREPLTIY